MPDSERQENAFHGVVRWIFFLGVGYIFPSLFTDFGFVQYFSDGNLVQSRYWGVGGFMHFFLLSVGPLSCEGCVHEIANLIVK